MGSARGQHGVSMGSAHGAYVRTSTTSKPRVLGQFFCELQAEVRFVSNRFPAAQVFPFRIPRGPDVFLERSIVVVAF